MQLDPASLWTIIQPEHFDPSRRTLLSVLELLTRLYVQVPEEVAPEYDQVPGGAEGVRPDDARQRRSKITLEGILKQAADGIQPYYLRPKDGAVDWWAAYQIGQRVSPEFIGKDSKGAARVFITGDGTFALNFCMAFD